MVRVKIRIDIWGLLYVCVPVQEGGFSVCVWGLGPTSPIENDSLWLKRVSYKLGDGRNKGVASPPNTNQQPIRLHSNISFLEYFYIHHDHLFATPMCLPSVCFLPLFEFENTFLFLQSSLFFQLEEWVIFIENEITYLLYLLVHLIQGRGIRS